jgi:hypothetical protein
LLISAAVRTFIILVCAAAAGSCLRVDVDSGVLECSSNPSRRCPEGYFCAANDTCWKNDSMFSADAGASAKHQGQACTLASDCDTGYCVDRVCCDSPCSGQCQACDVGGGVCTTIAGAPRGNRPACATAGFDACASVCDGRDATVCTYPDSSKPCGAQSCSSPPAVLKSATVCDGFGGCTPTSGMVTTPCPTPPGGTAVCSGDHCDFVCNPPYQRQGSMCVVPGDMG